jgi:transposase
LPREKSARQALGATIGADGFQLLTTLVQPDAPPELRALPAVQILRQLWLQQYYAPQQQAPVRWRDEADTPPPAQLIHSPYDLEARYSIKRGTTWLGYKAHLTETCEEDLPRVITHVASTTGTTQDDQVTATIHADLAAKQLLPAEHLVDAGYTSAQLLVSSPNDHQVDLFGPVAADPSWQARAGAGYALACFSIDWHAQVVTCPERKHSQFWKPKVDEYGRDVMEVRFSAHDCGPCALRPHCSSAKSEPRGMTILAREPFLALQEARQRQSSPEFKADYALRSGCESTISQGLRGFDLRRSGYVGHAKTHREQVITAVALTLVRVMTWLADDEPTPRPPSRFAALAPSGSGFASRVNFCAIRGELSQTHSTTGTLTTGNHESSQLWQDGNTTCILPSHEDPQ